VHVHDSPDEAAFRAEARAWLERHARRRSGAGDWSEQRVPTSAEAERAHLERCRSWQRTLFEGGYAAITWPVELGGRAGTPAEAMIFDEEQAAFDVTTGFLRSIIALVGPVLRLHGTDWQRERFLRPLLRGDEIWCQLFSEPGAGSDLAGLATRAELDGDELVVTGQKVWTSGAHHADWGIALVRTNPDAPKHRGITFLVVDMHDPGVTVRPLRQMTGAAHFNEVFLDGVRVPRAHVVGEIDGGWAPARTVLTHESAMIGSGAGMDRTERLLELARQTGASADPRLRQRLASLWAHERTLGWMAHAVKAAVRRGVPPPVDGSVLKLAWARTLVMRGDLALAVLGAAGIAAGHADAERWQHELCMRFAGTIGGGTSEVHRTQVGERVLGLPAEPRADKDVAWRDLPRS
jgi:alkylation response protein AidB-like acyl-CoA dehydrogenase